MPLTTLHRAMFAAVALLALGVAARMWPQEEFTPPPLMVRPLPEDLCTARQEGACLAPGYGAAEIVPLYGLPPESADRIRVHEDGTIAFEADRP